MKILKFLSLFVLSLSMLFLVGCSDKALIDNEEMVEKYTKMLPNISYVSMEHIDSDYDEFGENRYQFKNNEFSFEVRNYMTQDSTFGFNSNVEKDDYVYRLVEYHLSTLRSMADKYNVILLTDSISPLYEEYASQDWTYKTDDGIAAILNENLSKSVVSLELSHIDAYDSFSRMNIYLGNYTHIDNVYKFLNEFFDFIRGYFPKKQSKELNYYFNYRIYDFSSPEQKADSSIFHDFYYNSFYILNQPSHISESESLWVKHKLAYEVRQNHLADRAVDYAKSLEFSPIYINKLNIDGVVFECTSTFGVVLNIEDGQYYCSVYSGDNVSLNSSDEIELSNGEETQKAFLELLYGDVDYTITDKLASRSYRINGLTYKILETNLGKKYEFYRNGKDLKINSINEVPYFMNYYNCKYIPLKDFARICALQLDSIDIRNGVAYLSKLSK